MVEDHVMVRDMVCQLIERTPDLAVCGWSGSAEEALVQFPQCRPQMVLVDLSLPGMDGLALIEHLHVNEPGVRTLAVSAYMERKYVVRAREAGARGYIMKDELIRVVDAIRAVYAGGVFGW